MKIKWTPCRRFMIQWEWMNVYFVIFLHRTLRWTQQKCCIHLDFVNSSHCNPTFTFWYLHTKNVALTTHDEIFTLQINSRNDRFAFCYTEMHYIFIYEYLITLPQRLPNKDLHLQAKVDASYVMYFG